MLSLMLTLLLLATARSSRARTIKKGAIPFKDQLAAKPVKLLRCRFHRKHADEDFNVVVDRKGFWRVWSRCIHCERITVWEVRMRDGQRTLISGATVPGYLFEGVGRRTAAERGVIDATYVGALAEEFGVGTTPVPE